ncbi:exonuclease subunit SbcD [Anaerococcus sp. AGMB00486]|uniref:Nuclease SbcCD subunit D n=2 Tax=Anaerococcus TaxID=165779 RepID=A0ABX2N890_9FIRM|nr:MULTISPECIES: exonuclease SbcCD subunit D C-terminal domain-containing protein [Anaerococcus]MDY3006423.1 exonuclease SbcCD subunit D C-terminal domain-containing protein [Anaerococcus porci]MSS77281.1 exonuclease SbcCD subunit D [Anaerococcus porci]NVF10916.1 exonuclease subunit SbcD [Anaerococcus faecalis]
MRILHLSDLHIGKMIGNYSLLEEQKYGLDQILDIVKRENVDLIIIAGDIFDTSIPKNEAMKVYDDFINSLVFKFKKKVIAIAGNHDSGKRLEISKSFFEKSNYFVYGDSFFNKISFEDSFGTINFYPIPFISLARARSEIDPNIESFNDLYKILLKDIDYEDRNVLISHCYANESANEDTLEIQEGEKPLSIGGNDAMDAHLFMKFDYVALGHLHRKHFVLDEKIRYSGSFMKYSFSEVNQRKTVSIIDLNDNLKIKEIEIKALNDFRVIDNYFEKILKMKDSNDYIQFILKDKNPIDSPMAKLKLKFPNAVSIKYQYDQNLDISDKIDIDIKNLSTLEIIKKFYEFKMDEKMPENEESILKRVLE